MGAGEREMAGGGEGEAPFEKERGGEKPKEIVAEQRAGAGGENEFADADGERGEDGAWAEPLQPGTSRNVFARGDARRLIIAF